MMKNLLANAITNKLSQFEEAVNKMTSKTTNFD